MEILQLLKKDHQKVKALLDELMQTSARATVKRKELLQQLKAELQLHEQIEEDYFYPKLKNADKELVAEGYQEHHVVDVLIAELEQTEPNDEAFKAKVTVLQENLLHHIKEEEQEMFKEARQKFSKDQLNEMGKKMQEIKEKATSE